MKFKMIFIFLILVVSAEALYLILKQLPFKKNANEKPLDLYAQEVVSKCSNVSYRPKCYDDEIPKLMDYISMEDAFEVTRLVQQKDNSYVYCHVLGHELSAKETAKDPSKWKEVIARAPSGICSNGAIHGAFQERFRTDVLTPEEIEKLKPELSDVCEARGKWNPTGLEQASCYHAFGHLLMYITGADINKSVELCDENTIKGERNYSQLCYDGAFMQIYQPLEPEDFALVAGKQPTREQQPDFCRKFDPKRRISCWSEGWPLFGNDILDPKKLVGFCSYLSSFPEGLNRCYSAMFYVVTPRLNFETERVNDFCSGIVRNVRGMCFANAASRTIETDWSMIDRSVEMCRSAQSLGVGDDCWQELLTYSTYNFHAGSGEFFKICNSLPDNWKDKCLSGSR